MVLIVSLNFFKFISPVDVSRLAPNILQLEGELWSLLGELLGIGVIV